jgi:hypothetical protein
MITAEHIQTSIDNALAGKSNLTEDILKVAGFSTPTIRHLFNNLCNIEGTYLEIGLFCGASFTSSFNPNCVSIGVEDHSQDFSAGFESVKQQLKDNVDRFSDRAKEVQIHYTDCFTMDKSVLPDNIDIYCYDAEHSTESTAKSLPYFVDKMADTFCLILDDINWAMVSDGIDIALNELKDKIEIEKVWVLRGYHLQNDSIWHNGLKVYLIKKK